MPRRRTYDDPRALPYLTRQAERARFLRAQPEPPTVDQLRARAAAASMAIEAAAVVAWLRGHAATDYCARRIFDGRADVARALLHAETLALLPADAPDLARRDHAGLSASASDSACTLARLAIEWTETTNDEREAR